MNALNIKVWEPTLMRADVTQEGTQSNPLLLVVDSPRPFLRLSSSSPHCFSVLKFLEIDFSMHVGYEYLGR